MSDREIMIIGKLLLTFGVLLGLPIWELRKLRRYEQQQLRDGEASATVRVQEPGAGR